MPLLCSSNSLSSHIDPLKRQPKPLLFRRFTAWGNSSRTNSVKFLPSHKNILHSLKNGDGGCNNWRKAMGYMTGGESDAMLAGWKPSAKRPRCGWKRSSSGTNTDWKRRGTFQDIQTHLSVAGNTCIKPPAANLLA